MFQYEDFWMISCLQLGNFFIFTKARIDELLIINLHVHIYKYELFVIEAYSCNNNWLMFSGVMMF